MFCCELGLRKHILSLGNAFVLPNFEAIKTISDVVKTITDII